MLSATTILFAFWLAVVWYCDVDGFRERRRIEPTSSMRTPAAPGPAAA